MGFGIFFVGYLVYPGSIERLSIVALTIYLYVFIRYINRIRILYVLLGIFFGFLLGSYGLFFFEYRVDENNFRFDVQKKENTAVLLLFEGEPSTYDLSLFLKNISQENDFIYKIRVPFQLHRYKKAYEKMGMSRYADISMEIRNCLSEHLNYGYDVFLGYVSNKPYYGEIFRQKILKANYQKVIIAPIDIKDAFTYQRIIQAVEQESTYFPDFTFKIMPPLWDSYKVAASLVERVCTINDSMESDEIGIILLNSRKPENFEELHPDPFVQEQSFMEELKSIFVANGFEDRKIKSAALHALKREIFQRTEELQQYGVEKIYVVSAMNIEEKIDIQYKIEKLMKKLNRSKGIEMEHIKGWGLEEMFVEELEYRIRMMNVEIWLEEPEEK